MAHSAVNALRHGLAHGEQPRAKSCSEGEAHPKISLHASNRALPGTEAVGAASLFGSHCLPFVVRIPSYT
jgi:hypothetical protein